MFIIQIKIMSEIVIKCQTCGMPNVIDPEYLLEIGIFRCIRCDKQLEGTYQVSSDTGSINFTPNISEE